MVGVSRKHQPVKEPQPRRPRVGKQPVLFGRGPDRAQMVQQPPRRGRFAVDADDAPCSPRRLHPGAQTHLFALFIQRDHDGPGPPQGLARLAPPHFLRRRPAQALAGRQQADRLQQVGLARPVRPMQHHGPAGNRQAGARIGTEVGEGEGGDHKALGSGRRRIAPTPVIQNLDDIPRRFLRRYSNGPINAGHEPRQAADSQPRIRLEDIASHASTSALNQLETLNVFPAYQPGLSEPSNAEPLLGQDEFRGKAQPEERQHTSPTGPNHATDY